MMVKKTYITKSGKTVTKEYEGLAESRRRRQTLMIEILRMTGDFLVLDKQEQEELDLPAIKSFHKKLKETIDRLKKQHEIPISEQPEKADFP